MKTTQSLTLCHLLLLVLVPSAVVEAAASYTISNIGPMPSNGFFVPTSINSSGQVVGFVDGLPMLSFLYQGANMINLGSLGGPATLAYGINDLGEITGHSTINGTGVPEHAFLYSNGTMTDLGSLGQDSYGQAINNSGQITGFFSLADRTTLHAFLYSNGVMTDIGVLPGTAYTEGLAINDAGQVVGESNLAGGYSYHAFLYSNGVMTDLGTLGGVMSSASAINDAGQIVGESSTGVWAVYYSDNIGRSVDEVHAFLDSNGAMIDLGTLGGDTSQADAINNLGQIVGESEITLGAYTEHAFLDENGTMIDLNSLIDPASGWILNEATGINDSGQIIGDGTYDGQEEGFLLTPTSITSIPEPAAIPLAAALCLLPARRRRKARLVEPRVAKVRHILPTPYLDSRPLIWTKRKVP